MIIDGQWLETADVTGSLAPFEFYNGTEGLERYKDTSALHSVIAKDMFRTLSNAPQWIPFASEVYKTSPDPKDYFVVPTIIMPSDLPNRNGAAFPLAELTKFNPEVGDLAYRGWKGKPVHVEHANMDPTKAIGAVVDVTMRKLAKTGLWKVITLMAIDRTKNKPITGAILSGARKHYSMGAKVRAHTCSVCGALGVIKANHKTQYDGLACGREHASLNRHGQFRTFPTADGKMSLGFLNTKDITPFEVSTVGIPAYVSADSSLAELKGL